MFDKEDATQHGMMTIVDAYSQIEKLIADKYGKDTTTRKAVGDCMLTDTHAVNGKTNNVAKQN